MVCEIISIGNELLTGLTVNTNATFIGERLTALGVDVRYVTTIRDDETDIVSAFQMACERADLVISTGGLGPTEDDLTKTAFARFINRPLKIDPVILNQIEERFKKRGIEMSFSNRNQAEIPETCTILDNPVGSAPGLFFQYQNARIYILPGVPKELEAFITDVIEPALRPHIQTTLLSRLIKTTGIPESQLADQIHDFSKRFPDVQIAYLPEFSGVKIRLIRRSGAQDSQFQEAADYVYQQVGSAIYGEDDDTLESVIVSLLTQQKKTLSIAESCTGGMISSKITNVPGSSACFERGFVTYSNDAKMEHLHVPEATIIEHGAVSARTAQAMAEGVRLVADTDFGLSMTGIAGPGGGTNTKPVGLTYIGLASKDNVTVQEHKLMWNRQTNREIASYRALNLLRCQLIKFS